jgi:anti-sigma B factor antagonist
MSLEIIERKIEGIVILDLSGPLTLGNGEGLLRDRIAALRQSGKVNVVLNLKEVNDIDSTGLGTLVFGLAKLRKAGGKLALVNVHQSHVELFLLTKLAITFEFFGDEHDAVNSFFPDRAIQHFDILEFVQLQGAPVLHRELRARGSLLD